MELSSTVGFEFTFVLILVKNKSALKSASGLEEKI